MLGYLLLVSACDVSVKLLVFYHLVFVPQWEIIPLRSSCIIVIDIHVIVEHKFSQSKDTIMKEVIIIKKNSH